MSNGISAKEGTAIIVSLIFLVFGFLAVWVVKDLVGVTSDALFVTVLLVPIFVYMIVSGRLKELRAGSIEAKFTDLASSPVEPARQAIEASIDDMEVVAKGGIDELEIAMQQIDESRPLTLTLIPGRHYVRELLLEYLKTMSQSRNFKLVVILDPEGRFIAYMPAWMARQTLEMDALGFEFIEALNEGRLQRLRRYPGMETKTITTAASNTQALQAMIDQNLEALVVIDDEGKLKGIVERDSVLSRLMLALSGV